MGWRHCTPDGHCNAISLRLQNVVAELIWVTKIILLVIRQPVLNQLDALLVVVP